MPKSVSRSTLALQVSRSCKRGEFICSLNARFDGPPVCSPGANAIAADRPQDEEQDHGSDESNHDAPDQANAAVNEEPDQKAADQGADQADDEVADQPVAASPHHPASQPPGNQDDDDPRK